MGSHLSLAVEPKFFGRTSIQSRALGFGIRHTVHPLFDLWAHLPFEFVPPNLIDHIARLLPIPEGTAWRRIALNECGSEWLQAKGVDDIHGGNEHAVIYFHGGAFVTCGLNTHRRLIAGISAAADQPVLNVGYRQMPDEPIVSTIEDCIDGFRWLLDQGYKAENITVAGDSAGGYLAFNVARAVIDNGWGRPAGVVALSPLLDFDTNGKLGHRNANRCQTFSMAAVARLARMADKLDVKRGVHGKRICPVNLPLSDLPPTLIHIGSHEVLMADAELMANRLVKAGVPCDLQVWNRQVHVFQAAAAWVPEARTAIDEIGHFIQNLNAAEKSVPQRAPAAPGRRHAKVSGVR